jgi:hypothetical protein
MKIISIPAYLWAVACFILVPVTFIKNDVLAEQLAKLSFMKIHPVFSGGELNRKYQEDSLEISVNHPVVASAIGDRKQMVQITFAAAGQLPEQIDRTIDYDFNSHPDFRVTINTKNGATKLTPLAPAVKSLWASSKVKDAWVVRINLEK